MITFDNWQHNSSDHIDWQVTIDDESHKDYFTFNVSIGKENPSGDILGFAFDSLADFDLTTDLVNYSTYELSSFGTDSLNCGPGCNFNGAVSTGFDYIFRVGQQGSGNDYVSEFSFGLAKNGFSLDENLFSRIGIRAQSVGNDCENTNCNGSVKDYSQTPNVIPPGDEVTEVPEPGTALLLGLTLFGFAVRRKK
ncbi:PEP-CTERM sorting domain-containing protein [Thalassomonas viridans]|uniref:PEP-CTERM sorting domain-containing protein n=1 Tax=Thalassomonas viridans TaxID=137584 RepID=A0AAE9YZF1_9GAMM|nr:PEP-CTERM sorting domain-containing protein [Thalassomonas viridans]WDE03397.1 PEP-CTERM sorting domain-containing protein [Thalassomonas viridans]